MWSEYYLSDKLNRFNGFSGRTHHGFYCLISPGYDEINQGHLYYCLDLHFIFGSLFGTVFCVLEMYMHLKICPYTSSVVSYIASCCDGGLQ
jgi:hypothetical protein